MPDLIQTEALTRPTLPWVEVHRVPRLQEGGTLHPGPFCPGPSNASKPGAENSDHNKKKVRKVASNTEESSEQEDSGSKTIGLGRIKTVRI